MIILLNVNIDTFSETWYNFFKVLTRYERQTNEIGDKACCHMQRKHVRYALKGNETITRVNSFSSFLLRTLNKHDPNESGNFRILIFDIHIVLLFSPLLLLL